MVFQRPKFQLTSLAFAQRAIKWVLVSAVVLVVLYPTTGILPYQGQPTSYIHYELAEAVQTESTPDAWVTQAKMTVKHLNLRHMIPTTFRHGYGSAECAHKTGAAHDRCLQGLEVIENKSVKVHLHSRERVTSNTDTKNLVCYSFKKDGSCGFWMSPENLERALEGKVLRCQFYSLEGYCLRWMSTAPLFSTRSVQTTEKSSKHPNSTKNSKPVSPRVESWCLKYSPVNPAHCIHTNPNWPWWQTSKRNDVPNAPPVTVSPVGMALIKCIVFTPDHLCYLWSYVSASPETPTAQTVTRNFVQDSCILYCDGQCTVKERDHEDLGTELVEQDSNEFHWPHFLSKGRHRGNFTHNHNRELDNNGSRLSLSGLFHLFSRGKEQKYGKRHGNSTQHGHKSDHHVVPRRARIDCFLPGACHHTDKHTSYLNFIRETWNQMIDWSSKLRANGNSTAIYHAERSVAHKSKPKKGKGNSTVVHLQDNEHSVLHKSKPGRNSTANQLKEHSILRRATESILDTQKCRTLSGRSENECRRDFFIFYLLMGIFVLCAILLATLQCIKCIRGKRARAFALDVKARPQRNDLENLPTMKEVVSPTKGSTATSLKSPTEIDSGTQSSKAPIITEDRPITLDGTSDGWNAWIKQQSKKQKPATLPKSFSAPPRSQVPQIPSLQLPQTSFATVRKSAGLESETEQYTGSG